MAGPKKTNPKSMDVTSAGVTTPDTTARPIIVSNRAMIQDPMLQAGKASDGPTTSPLLTTTDEDTDKPLASSLKKNINPVDTDPKTDTPDKKDKPQVPAKLQETETKTTVDVAKQAVDEASQTEAQKSVPDEAQQMPEDSDEKATPNQPAKSSASVTKEVVADKTQDSTDGATTKTESVAGDAPEQDSQVDESNQDDDKDKPIEQDSEAKQQAEAAEAEAAELERIEHIKTLINDKTYFVETKHQKTKGAGWLIVLILLAGAGGALAYLVVMSGK